MSSKYGEASAYLASREAAALEAKAASQEAQRLQDLNNAVRRVVSVPIAENSSLSATSDAAALLIIAAIGITAFLAYDTNKKRKMRGEKPKALLEYITPETTKFATLMLNSPAAIALVVAIAPVILWNLEHISLAKTNSGWTFRRLSTEDTSLLRDPNTTPIAAPLLSNAVRLADTGVDSAVAASQLAQQQLANTGQKGALPALWEFLFGAPAKT